MKKINYIIIAFISLTILSCGNKEEKTKSENAYKHAFKQVENDPLNTLIYTLENGLKVYISVNKDEPRIQTNIAVNTGSKQDPSDATGLAHYLEHMLFKGTSKIASLDWEKEKVLLKQISDLYEKRKTVTDEEERKLIYQQIDSLSGEASKYVVPNEYDKLISALGAKGTNAYTSLERTVYINDIPSNELEKWLTIESERFSELVLRLFHTELEAVYEEFNRAQDSDWRLSYYTMMKHLFKRHTYGTQSTIGTSEHLKNPSMEKIHEYFNTYYVPNNMAIILSGDLDPDKTVDLIEKHFGSYKPKDIPQFTFEAEDEILEPEIVEVQGSESEWVDIGFRLNGIKAEDTYILPLMDGLLANGQAGLIDLNLVNDQKVLDAYSTYSINKDYSLFQLHAEPREGQTLEEAKALLLEQLNLIKSGDFDDWMLPAVIKNFKLDDQKNNAYNSYRAYKLTDAFILEQDWATVVNKNEKLSSLTKKDIVDFANKYLNENYIVVYKRHGNRESVKVEKPAITNVELNRDTISAFAKKVEAMEESRLTPVFDNYKEDIKKTTVGEIPLYYVENTTNETFQLNYILEMGSLSDKELALATNYLKYLGTDKYSAKELQMEMFKLGLTYDVNTSKDKIYVSLSGLEESLEDGIILFEHILANVQPNAEAYNNLVDGILKERSNDKMTKWKILYNGMYSYAKYGNNSPFKNILSETDLKDMNIDKLVDKIKTITSYEHIIYYYGRKDINAIKTLVEKHHKTPDKLTPIIEPEQYTELEMSENKVYFVNYDMVQSEILMLSKTEPYNKDILAQSRIFNEYFGSGLSSIIFQEIRESKALAYSAYAYYASPRKIDESHYIQAYIGTQVDKLNDATTAIMQLLNDMPEVQGQFEDAKVSALKKIETSRTKRNSLFWKYLRAKEFNYDHDINQDLYPKIEQMKMTDVKQFFNEKIKNRKYTYLVIGNKNLVDTKTLEEIGKYKELTLEDVFGY